MRLNKLMNRRRTTLQRHLPRAPLSPTPTARFYIIVCVLKQSQVLLLFFGWFSQYGTYSCADAQREPSNATSLATTAQRLSRRSSRRQALVTRSSNDPISQSFVARRDVFAFDFWRFLRCSRPAKSDRSSLMSFCSIISVSQLSRFCFVVFAFHVLILRYGPLSHSPPPTANSFDPYM